MIADLIDCDTCRIEAAEPYSSSYDATVERNVRERDDDPRPAIANLWWRRSSRTTPC